MRFRRALLSVSGVLALAGSALAVEHAPSEPTVLNAHAGGTKTAVETTTTTDLTPETTVTTSSIRNRVTTSPRTHKIYDVIPTLPTLPRGIADPCTATLVDADVANANDEGTYEIARGTGNFHLVARSHGLAAYNPDGKRIAYVIDETTQPRMCLANRSTKEAHTLFVGDFIQASVPNYPMTWTDANSLVFAQLDAASPPGDPPGYSVFRFDLLTSLLTRVVGNVSAFAVSPSHKFVAYAVPTGKTQNQSWDSGALYVAPLKGGQARQLFSDSFHAITEVRWSHDENTIAIGDPLYLVDVGSGVATNRSSCGDGEFGGAWSPKESRFAFAASFDPTKPVCAISPQTSDVIQLGSGGRPEDWSSDGDHLVLTALTDFTSTQLTTVLSELTISTHETKKLFSYVSQASEPHFFGADYSPDGATIRFCNKVAI